MPLGSKRKDKPAETVTYADEYETFQTEQGDTMTPVGEGRETPTNGSGADSFVPVVEETTDDVFKVTRNVTPKPNPLLDAVRVSWNEGCSGKAVPAATKDTATKVVNMLRRAAKTLQAEGIGVRIVDRHAEDGKVHFKAKKYTPKPRENK